MKIRKWSLFSLPLLDGSGNRIQNWSHVFQGPEKKYILPVFEIVFIEIKFVIFYHFLLNQSLFIEEGCYNLP